MKTSIIDNSQVVAAQSQKRKLFININNIEHTNAQKRIMISPKSSTNKSSNEDKNRFFKPT